MRESRLSKIETYIRGKQVVSLDELCDAFNVSKSTIRRDISELTRQTDIRKIYGGVSVPHDRIPPPFSERSVVNMDEKERIGICASQLVDDGDVIYVDSGTTTSQLIPHLTGRKNVTIITHSLDVMNRAVKNPELTVVALSGTLNRKTFSFTGQSTIEVLRDYNISKAFMAANGITLENGATQSTAMEFAIKKMVVSRSDMVILMIESHKVGEVSLMTYCDVSRIDTIVTEKGLPTDFQTAYESMGGTILYP